MRVFLLHFYKMRTLVVLYHAVTLLWFWVLKGLIGFHLSTFVAEDVSLLDPLSTVGVIVGANQVPKLWCPVSCPAPEEIHNICTGLADMTEVLQVLPVLP